jgi:hypothetical protein
MARAKGRTTGKKTTSAKGGKQRNQKAGGKGSKGKAKG